MRVFVIAGEPSGDKLGGALMRGLRALSPDIQFSGIGGHDMIGEGLESLFPMQELSVMGIVEVLPKYFHLKRRIKETAEAVVSTKPDVLVTIDSPDFCLRVAKLVKAHTDLRTVHYVAPTVWAWRPGRAVKMAKTIDEVLCLFPFEPPLMQDAGMGAHFVGHPVVSQVHDKQEDRRSFGERFQIASETPVALVLPGSRKGEVTRLAPVFGKALAQVVETTPDLRVVVPTVANTEAMVRDLTLSWPGAPLILSPDQQDEKHAAFAAADVALAASGTVSLELAAAGTPMVIAYDMNFLSRWLIGALLKIDTVTLVNLVSDTRTVPEFLGRNCRSELIAPALSGLLQRSDARAAQQEAMALTMSRLGQGGEPPGLRAARAILSNLD